MKPKYQPRNNFLVKPSKPYFFIAGAVVLLTFLYIFWRSPDMVEISTTQPTPLPAEKPPREALTRPKFDGQRIVHLDLKGAPPKISYYSEFFPLIRLLGATGVMIEYEDMFPYGGELVNVSALNAYTRSDVDTINSLAKANGLSVVPLIQTFGHMEFVLKLEGYKDFREVRAYPQAVCPTYEKTLPLLTTMLRQLVEAHPDSDTIHIGADEVYYLGQCGRCNDFMSRNSFSKNQLFLEHINKVIGTINELFPHLRVLMWDDQLRSVTRKDLRRINFSGNVEPVVWKYTKEVYDELGPTLWDGYSRMFGNVWAASAFKGATGSNEFVADVTHYMQNNKGWLSILHDYRDVVNFQGIIVTGWQRYDHFAVLCELLPVGIPSLAMSLRILLGYTNSPLSPPTEVAKLLRCEQPYALMGPAFGSPRCSYPGADILEVVLRLQQLKQEFDSVLDDSRTRGWLNDYNMRHTFSSPNHVKSLTSSLYRIKRELEELDSDVIKALSDVYDDYTVEEWRETYVRTLEVSVDRLWRAAREILARESWPRRPLQEL